MTRKIFLAFTLALSLILACSVSSFAAFSNQNNPIIGIVKESSIAVVNIDVEKVTRRSVSPFPFDDDPFFRHFFGDSF
ncbi:MAG: protease, partial [Synergistaceae bacterium]|nr:protease [Synergistaceae bacterium]